MADSAFAGTEAFEKKTPAEANDEYVQINGKSEDTDEYVLLNEDPDFVEIETEEIMEVHDQSTDEEPVADEENIAEDTESDSLSDTDENEGNDSSERVLQPGTDGTENSSEYSIKGAIVSGLKEYTYSASERRPRPTVKMKQGTGTVTLKINRDFTLSYENNKSAGTAAVIITGKGKYDGVKKVNFTIKRRSLSGASVTNITEKVYNGRNIKQDPKVVVTIGDRKMTLKKDRDYRIGYSGNRDTGTAVMVIKGKGNFQGKIKRTFNITKAAPILKFVKKTVSKKRGENAFVLRLKKKTDGKISFTSSDPAVARINKKTGKVRISGLGTTTIKVTAAEGKNYSAGSASYELTVKRIGWNDLAYGFNNTLSGFGFPKNYRTPLYIYKKLYSDKQADFLYNEINTWVGECFGMSVTSVLFNNYGSGLSRSAMNVSGTKLHALTPDSYSEDENLTLTEIIEIMQAAQYDENVQKAFSNNRNLNQMCKAVIGGIKSGKLPVLGFNWYSGPGLCGHAVVGYRVKKISSTESRLYIYDPNFPHKTRYIKLITEGSRYTGWGYMINDKEYISSSYGAWMDFTPYSVYQPIWRDKKAYTTLSMYNIGSYDFEVYDAAGNMAAYMKDGVLSSTTDEIYQYHPLSGSANNVILYMPAGEYRIENKDPAVSEFEVRAVHVDQLITVETESDAVTINLNDFTGAGLVSIDAADGEAYEVAIESDLESATGQEEIVFAGEGSGKEVRLGTDSGEVVIANAIGTVVEINGEEAFSVK